MAAWPGAQLGPLADQEPLCSAMPICLGIIDLKDQLGCTDYKHPLSSLLNPKCFSTMPLELPLEGRDILLRFCPKALAAEISDFPTPGARLDPLARSFKRGQAACFDCWRAGLANRPWFKQSLTGFLSLSPKQLVARSGHDAMTAVHT